MNTVEAALRITHVTAYEDRAEVVRTGEVTLPAGTCTVRVPNVTPLAQERNLVVGAEGAETHVQDVRVERRWVHRASVDDAQQERLQGELEDGMWKEADARMAVDRAVAHRNGIQAMLGVHGQQLSRAMWPRAKDAPGWLTDLDTFRSALEAAEANVLAAQQVLHDATDRLEQLRATLRGSAQTLTQKAAHVAIRVQSAGGPVRLRLAMVVPCGMWRPVHEAHLTGDDRLRWEVQATVWQATGEPWEDVELVLSTARPSMGAELPVLVEDRLTLRAKTPDEVRTVRVAHRQEAISSQALKGSAPGVYDGGEARQFRPSSRVSIPSDGRPHRVAVTSYQTQCRTQLVCYPEVAPQVFLRASFINASGMALLAGPVTLLRDGQHVGVGDVPYVGPGESADVALGSEDRFAVGYVRSHFIEQRRLLSDRKHFRQEVELQATGTGAWTVEVVLRTPVSEVAQLKVVTSRDQCSAGLVDPDADGLVRHPVQVRPGSVAMVRHAFHLDADSNVAVPDPW